MRFYLPSREECREIVNSSEVFYCTTKNIQGYDIELYDYRLASYSDFFPKNEDKNYSELRGLCFVNNNGNWERHILMNKFFNINETLNWMYEDIKNITVDRVQEKLDGSIISLIKLPNGNIIAKSKMSFDSDQAIMAQKIYDNSKELQSLVQSIINDNKTPIFELVSPHNQIVLPYDNTELKLLQIRDNKSGKYLKKETINSYLELHNYKIKAQDYHIITGVNSYNVLDDLIEKARIEENIEGWIVTLETGQMVKIKTSWYFSMHGLVTEGTRENLLIETILENRIDDVISLIPDGEKKEFIKETTIKVQKEFNHLVVEYKKLRNLYFNKFMEDRKEFALKYNKHKLFSYVIKRINNSFRDVEQIAEESVKEYILNNTKKLNEAREFINNISRVS